MAKFRLLTEVEEGTVDFYLEDDDGVIVLWAKDSNGNEWAILNIDEDGLNLYVDIEPEIGFPVDKNGCIKIV